MASGLGLHCLPVSHKKDVRLIWVNDSIEYDCKIMRIHDRNYLVYHTYIFTFSKQAFNESLDFYNGL